MSKADIFSLITAFYKYTTEGKEAAVDMFPDAAEFIEKNKDRSFAAVEAELIAQIPTAQN